MVCCHCILPALSSEGSCHGVTMLLPLVWHFPLKSSHYLVCAWLESIQIIMDDNLKDQGCPLPLDLLCQNKPRMGRNWWVTPKLNFHNHKQDSASPLCVHQSCTYHLDTHPSDNDWIPHSFFAEDMMGDFDKGVLCFHCASHSGAPLPIWNGCGSFLPR